MSTNGRPSMLKRQKEQHRLEKQREKAARRQQRKVDKQNGVTAPSDGADATDAMDAQPAAVEGAE